jgi:hypothetical protein
MEVYCVDDNSNMKDMMFHENYFVTINFKVFSLPSNCIL